MIGPRIFFRKMTLVYTAIFPISGVDVPAFNHPDASALIGLTTITTEVIFNLKIFIGHKETYYHFLLIL